MPFDLDSLQHDGSARYVWPQHVHLNDVTTIRLRSHPQAPLQRVLLRACPDGEQLFVEMRPRDESAVCRWWEAPLKITMPVTGYRFLVFTRDGVWWYTGAGLQAHVPTDQADFKIVADYAAPDWVRSAVFYQIFPDRFADGDPANNVRDGEWSVGGHPARSRAWGEPLSTVPHADMVEFFGGDLAGVEQHLDDLVELGINAIYLNPVFTSYSNHRYDVADYDNVDPHLGGNAALIALRQATRQRGLRLMLDIVPNHCGVRHPWFQAAQADRAAPTAEFFTFHQHPHSYETWLGVKSLPKLNYDSAKVREMFYAGRDAIFRKWLREPYAIDGWRIDVANMLARQGATQRGYKIGRGIRAAVKEQNAQAYLLGENWFDGTEQLQGNIWDAVMNYAGFTHPLWYWLSYFYVRQHAEPYFVAADGPWPTRAMTDTWQAYRAGIPWAVARQQFNLLGSHDTARLLNILDGDAARSRLAVALLLTYPGVPSIYYGDEIGLKGDARDCMNWDRATWDHDLRAYYQRLIHLRTTSSALIEGGFQLLLTTDHALAFVRDSLTETIIVAANRHPIDPPGLTVPVAHGAIADGTEFTEFFSGARALVHEGHLRLPPQAVGATIWRTQR